GVEGRGDFLSGERAIIEARLLDLAGEKPTARALVPQAEEDSRFARLEFLHLGLGVAVAVGCPVAINGDAVVGAIDNGEVDQVAGLGRFLRAADVFAANAEVAPG